MKIGLEQELSYESRSVEIERVWREARYCWWSYSGSIIPLLHNHCSDCTKWSRISEKLCQQLHVTSYISVQRSRRISRKSLSAVIISLGSLKLGPFIGWNSAPEDIYWPTEGQAPSSFTLGDKASSNHRLLWPKRQENLYTSIHPPGWHSRPLALGRPQSPAQSARKPSTNRRGIAPWK